MPKLSSISFNRISWKDYVELRRKEECAKAFDNGAPIEVACELAEDCFGGNEEVTQVGYYTAWGTLQPEPNVFIREANGWQLATEITKGAVMPVKTGWDYTK